MNRNNLEVAVIGLGRFGLFWAKELSRFSSVYCYDIDPSKENIINEFAQFDSLPNCMGKRIIFLTLPIRHMENFLISNSLYLNSDSILLDCSSVKLKPKEWFKNYLPNNAEFGLLHPLFGPDSANNGLNGHTITYTEGNLSKENLNIIFGLFKDKLNLNIIEIDAYQHDRMIAYNLGLVHLLGRTINEMKIPDIPIKFGGFNILSQMTANVMKDRIELFQDFFNFNPCAEEVCKDFMEAINNVVSEKLGNVKNR